MLKSRKLLTLIAIVSFLAFLGSVSLLSFHVIEHTSTAEYCATCHEMEYFHQMWEQGPHGMQGDGVVKATCTDCHLPHGSTWNYLVAKARSGMRDMWAHALGREPDWEARLDKYEEFTYQSGCDKCHKKIVAGDIPLKAYTAHRDYRTGETDKTCIECHRDAGHGDLKTKLKSRKAGDK